MNTSVYLMLCAFMTLSMPSALAAWEACSGISGTCIDVRSHQCTASTKTGHCPGAWYNKCCPAPEGISSSGCAAKSGLCMRSTTCTTSAVLTGLCPGPSTVTCCTSASTTVSPTTTATSSSFAAALVAKTNAEYSTYGGLHECNDKALTARIGTYWSALGNALDGCDRNVPWSAAFVSYMVRSAGGAARFRYSAGHWVYISDAFRGGRGLYDSAVDITTATVKKGDIVCAGRKGKNVSTLGWKFLDYRNWYDAGVTAIPSHCDIVTDVAGDTLTVVGGNVAQSVTRSTVNKNKYAVLMVLS